MHGTSEKELKKEHSIEGFTEVLGITIENHKLKILHRVKMNMSGFENTETVEFCYASVNGSCLRAIRSTGARVTLYVLGTLAILVTLFGNMFVIISISHFKQLHTPTNYLVLSLAIADFLLGCMVMPYSLIRSIESCWYFGILFCKLHTSFDLVLCAASIIHLCCISVDRYYAVCNPLKYKTIMTVSTVLIMIFLSWALSFLMGFVMIFLELHLVEIKYFFYSEIFCFGGCPLMMGKVCALVYSTISFYFPAFIMVCIYSKIYLVAKKQARTINNLSRKVQPTSEGNSLNSQRSERKAAKTLGIVMGVFILCWSPYFVCDVIEPFIKYTTPPILFDAFFWVGYLNSTFNPMIYGFFYSWFRKGLKTILTCKIFAADSSRINLF